jgi:LytS/YehU family sensor histidine kinase
MDKTTVELFATALYEGGYLQGNGDEIQKLLEQAKEMQQEQSQLYATFVLMCVNNNLPPITFNDWVTNIRR